MSTVTLRPVDEDLLPRLLDVAVAEATLDEVMPPVPGPPGWTEERRAAFFTHHRTTPSYAILVDGEVAGAMRLSPSGAPGAAEIGMWLARGARGKGHATEALHLLIEEARARGTTALIAETTATNEPALGALRANGAKLWADPQTGAVHATLRVAEDPDHKIPH